MFEDFTENVEMPENLKEEFIKNMIKVTIEAFDNAGNNPPKIKFDKFITDFVGDNENEIYEFHLKEYSEKELWQSMIITQSDDFKKMMNFQVRLQQYLGELMIKFQDKHEEEEYLEEEKEDNWSTE